MTLSTLIATSKKLVKTITNDPDITVSGIKQDSRQVTAKDVFVAIRGATTDGHQFIDKVLEQGVLAIVAEQDAPTTLPVHIVWINTTDSAALMGQMASVWHGQPSHHMHIVGVTGTNGKTTVATLLWQAATQAGWKCGLVSTVENRIGADVIPSTHTTPDALSLQKLFAQMRDAACTHVFMEVSSHAVHQKRIAGTQYVGGVFTNLTHDHLDYHGTFRAYLKAKQQFFDQLPKSAWAITNLDDRNGRIMVQNTKAQVITYALKHAAQIKGKVIENALSGLHLQINDQQMHARMIGSFNASNLLAVYGAMLQLGMETMQILTLLSNLRGAEGRFDYVAHATLPNTGGIIDYAHTPDALEKVIETIRHMIKNSGKLITIVGCGGDRDRTKRPIMARLAVENSQMTILTSDNPRTEAPEAILTEMETGLDGLDPARWITITDRAQAIKTACRLITPGDVILVAGKGHEKYQDINGTKHPFDDKAVLATYLK
jgi:UDP-N-acetylmuramoyl-L-alanyl-D-glutamate--2,6-diaminopimelate ligase